MIFRVRDRVSRFAGVGLFCALALCACDQTSDRNPRAGQLDRDEHIETRSLKVQVIDGKGRALTNPSWSASGDEILASGGYGRGRFSIELRENRIRALPQRALKQQRTPRRNIEGPYETLFDDGKTRILFNLFDSVLEVEDASGQRRQLDVDVSIPKASPDGKYVAYFQGHMSSPILRVVGVDGSLVFDGPGADPEWFPDGRRLVYTIPQGEHGSDGYYHVRQARLHLLDVETLDVVRLSDGRDDVKMNPAVSPDGRRVAFEEWKTMTIRIARIGARQGEQR